MNDLLDIMPGISRVAQTIQLALAPVFMLAGIGAFLNVCAGRLSRVIDRARTVEDRVLLTRGREHDRLVNEIRVLDRRISVVNSAIFLCVASACVTCIVVILLFAAQLFRVKLGTEVALLFILSMVLLMLSFGTFLIEVRLASKIIHIRNEVLFHKEGDPSDDA